MSIDEPGPLSPLAEISSSDKKGLIAVVTAIFLSSVLAFFYIQVHIRLKQQPESRKRDGDCIAAATFFAIAQSAVVFYAISKGYGKSGDLLSDDDFVEIGRAVYASNILYIVAVALSKCATLLLYLRLSPGRNHAIACWSAIGASVFWAVMSLLLITIRCSPAHPFVELGAQCSNLFVRWQIIGYLDISIEVAIFSISVYIVAGLQMVLRSKILVVLAFGSRLPTVLACALRLHYLGDAIPSSNPTLEIATAAICTQIHQDYSIMASTISCLGPFLSPFTSKRETYRRYASDDVKMGSLSTRRSGADPESRVAGTSDMPTLRKDLDECVTTVEVTHDTSSEQPSIASNDSDRLIIRKTTDWGIRTDHQGGSSAG